MPIRLERSTLQGLSIVVLTLALLLLAGCQFNPLKPKSDAPTTSAAPESACRQLRPGQDAMRGAAAAARTTLSGAGDTSPERRHALQYYNQSALPQAHGLSG